MERMPDEALMQRVKELCKVARHVSAWALLQDLAPPESWGHTKWQVRAARVMDRVGGSLRSRKLVFRLWHGKESRAAVRELMFWEMLDMRGPLRAWQWLQANPPGPDAPEEDQTNHFAFRAYALAELRDFQRAAAELDEAFRRAPEKSWFHTVKSHLLGKEDRHAEALEAAEAAMRFDPLFVSPVYAAYEALLALGRDDTALTLLRDALGRMESNAIAARLVNLEIELELYTEATGTLDRYESLLPLMEESARNWIHARRCDLACHAGDYDTAKAWAEKITGSGFYSSIGARLAGVRDGLVRRLLPVGFVRQHHLTCSPASLAMICRYWDKPVEHVTLAEEICHDGTPHHLGRRWADEHGFATREFTVTVEAAKQVISAGIPFTLSTAYPGGAHCQVVAGFDEFRDVLLICDPDNRSKTEYLAEEGLQSMAFCGPRGMAMIPLDQAGKLAGLWLPESELHDASHQADLALHVHDRERAASIVLDLVARAPEHRITWEAKSALADYDGDPAAGLEAAEALCRLHPEDVNRQMGRISRMTTVCSSEDRLAALRKLCGEKDSHPLLWRMLARELHTDARHLPEARRWLTKVMRQRKDAVAWLTQANLLWDARRREEATELYRLASCWDGMNENLASSYFRAARWTKQTDTALAYLRDRVQRLGRTSGDPARTLYEALMDLDRPQEALAVIEESLGTRPEDAGQMLFAARIFADSGNISRASGLLAAAQDKGRPSDWHRAKARMLRRECQPDEALAEWNLVVVDEPLAMDAHRNIASLHERLHGAQAALRYTRLRCEQWPHHWPLHELLLDWARDAGPREWEEAARALVRLQPHNAWARRELALALEAQKKLDEAHAELDASEAIEPHSGSLHYVRGELFRAVGRSADAQDSYRRALEVDVDHTHALEALVQGCVTTEQRLEALEFVQEQITRQTTNGDSVSTFATGARPYLEARALQAFLEEAHRERPDLWQTWVTLGAQLRDHDKVDDAIAMLDRAVERFPLKPRIWSELAAAHAAKPDRVRQIEALEKVRQLDPAWGFGMRSLAEALDLAGRLDESRAVMEHAVRASPFDARNRGALAERQWLAGQREEALRHVIEAVRLDPGYDWAWDCLAEWSGAMERPECATEALDRLKQQRPMEPRTWMRVADSLTKREEFEQRIAALDKAITLNPHATGASDEKARVLGLAGRFDEALAACRNATDGTPQPAVLGRREAWLLARKGDLDGAITMMNAALAKDSASVWGWGRLSDWNDEKGDYAKSEEAVQQIARLRPNDAVPYGYIGDLRLKQDDREGAIRAFARSIELDPSYGFGGLELFRLYMEDKRYDDAEAVLNTIRIHVQKLTVWAREFALCCGRFTPDPAFTALQSMLECSDDEPGAFNRVLEELKHRPASWKKRAMNLCVACFRNPACNPHAGAFYVGVSAQLEIQPKERHLNLLPSEGAVVQRAYRRWFSTLGDQAWENSNRRMLYYWLGRLRVMRLMNRHRSMLRMHTELWGNVSYATLSLRMFKTTAHWLVDWRERSDVEGATLNNLFLALQETGDRNEAHAVMRHVLALPEHNQMTIRFHLWAAIEAALCEREPEARQLLEAVDARQFENFDKKLHAFLQVILRYQSDAQIPPKLDPQAKADLSALLEEDYRKRLVVQDFLRACRLIARRTHNPWFWMWGWKTAHPTLVLFMAAALLIVVVSWMQGWPWR
jgi:tetratricopeptide (TPR) repeat protein